MFTKSSRINGRCSASAFRPMVESLENRWTPSTLPDGFSETLVVEGLAKPTAFELVPDGRVFIAEQGGNVRVVRDGTLLAAPLYSVPVDSAGERGLLGVTVDPQFPANGFVYIYHTVPGSPPHNRITRLTVAGNTAITGSVVVLFEIDPLSAAINHNGGALHFGQDGKLYVGVGENNNGANAQSLGNALGKILRLNPDGSIPPDNPFVTTATGTGRAIWALGLRNPFTFAVQAGTGRIFINDVGGNKFEEIDDGMAGANYGWPAVEGPSNNPSFRDPLFAYGHGSGNTLGIAISGGAFYNPVLNQFPSDYVGDYFFADFGNRWIRRYDPADGSVTLFASDVAAGPVDLRVSPGGSLFYLSRGFGGAVGSLRRIDRGSPSANALFVSKLYADALGRTAQSAEIDYWTSQLPFLGQAGVARGVFGSHEAHLKTIRTFYGHFLGRNPEPAGESFWTSRLDSGESPETIASLILGSAEFRARATALEGTSDADSNYIRSLYRLLLLRSGGAVTEGELGFWRTVLPSTAREQVALVFLGSSEFRSNAVRANYGDPTAPPALPFVPNLLRRAAKPQASEVLYWANSSLNILEIAAEIAGAPEYFPR